MARLSGMLARKGYPGGLAFQVVAEALRTDGAEALAGAEGAEGAEDVVGVGGLDDPDEGLTESVADEL